MKAVKINSQKYPALLKQISSPPSKIYYKGNWDNKLFDKCLAVVGTRQMTSYGRRVTEWLVADVASMGITIVSGFMYGVDAQAHRAALIAGGRTIAVMPCGINVIHPAHQEKLYAQIIENNGLIISEFAGDFLPQIWSYPRRNRIVAGLSQATLVVEAGEKSGSLITAALAQKYRRKLFSVPGPLTSPCSKGTLQLIKNGAAVVTGAGDILEEYGVSPAPNNNKSLAENKVEQDILDKLIEEERSIDVLSRLIKIPAAELGALLSLMQLRGVINQEAGKYYINANAVITR